MVYICLFLAIFYLILLICYYTIHSNRYGWITVTVAALSVVGLMYGALTGGF